MSDLTTLFLLNILTNLEPEAKAITRKELVSQPDSSLIYLCTSRICELLQPYKLSSLCRQRAFLFKCSNKAAAFFFYLRQ